MKHSLFFATACIINFILFEAIVAQTTSTEESEASKASIFFEDVRVFDGDQMIDSTSVLVEDGLITAIGSDLVPNKLSKVVDGKGKTLLPGLIDCHVHTWFETHLNQAALFGVTTELDMMSSPAMMRVFRSQQQAGNATQRADVFSAGAAVTVKDGHGTQFGMPVPTVADASEVPVFVRTRIKEGSDYIKLIYEDGSAYGYSRPTLDEAMFAAAVDAAHASKKLAVAHVSTADGADLAFRNDIDGLVHLFANQSIDQELVDKAKKHGAFIVPTAAVVSNTCGSNTTARIIKDPNLRKLLTNQNLANLAQEFPVGPQNKNSWANLSHNIVSLHRAGVPILAGTDAPNPGTVHGASMHHELRLLVEAGLSPVQAMAAATSKPADCFRLKDRGRIAKGLRADLLLLQGNPANDIKDLANISGVWKAGIQIDRLKRLASVRNEIERAARKRVPADEDRLISNFETDEGKSPSSNFGAGWQTSTDSMTGGDSTCTLSWSSDGSANSQGSLVVAGSCRKTQPRFAGAMLYPGKTMMAPEDLSSYGGISFMSKGDGTDLKIMLFTTKGGFMPSIKSFTAANEWTKHSFAFDDFGHSDGSDVTGIWFGCDSPGQYSFQIDNVTLTR